MNDNSNAQNHTRAVWVVVWILSLAFLSVGARNFELGLSLDAPLWATIARNIAQTGEWFRLDGSTPDFVPVAEHPHLGLWLVAVVFNWLPAADWSARIVGHCFYVAFLLTFFFYVRSKSNERTATWGVVLLWSWHLFSNVHSNVYLDPGCLFFGTWAIILFDYALTPRLWYLSVLGGVSLALCAMYKGVTVLGFVPALACLALFSQTSRTIKTFTGLAFILSAVAVFSTYVILVLNSNAPEFFDIYWANQMTNRFNLIVSITNFFKWDYWSQLLRYTNYMAPLALLALIHIKSKDVWLPFVLGMVYIGLFATTDLRGGQYLIMIMPWLAWGIAKGALQYLPIGSRGLMRFTQYVAIIALFVVQYIPMKTHAAQVYGEQEELAKLSEQGIVDTLYLDLIPVPKPFVISTTYAWYSKVNVRYPNQGIPPADAKQAYFLFHQDDVEKERQLLGNGWCYSKKFDRGHLWLKCSDKQLLSE